MQHLVHKVLHGFLSWPAGLSIKCAGKGRKVRWESKTHGLESALFSFRNTFSGSDVTDWGEGGRVEGWSDVSRRASVCNARGSICVASLNRTLCFGQIVHDSHHDTPRHRMSNDCAHRVDSREIKRSDSSPCNIQGLVGYAHGKHSHAVHMIRYAMIPHRVITHIRGYAWGGVTSQGLESVNLCCVREDQLHPRTGSLCYRPIPFASVSAIRDKMNKACSNSDQTDLEPFQDMEKCKAIRGWVP
jgi:hypothetical protein